jgi:hypothetical protein
MKAYSLAILAHFDLGWRFWVQRCWCPLTVTRSWLFLVYDDVLVRLMFDLIIGLFSGRTGLFFRLHDTVTRTTVISPIRQPILVPGPGTDLEWIYSSVGRAS